MSPARYTLSTPLQRLAALGLAALACVALLAAVSHTADHHYDSALLSRLQAVAVTDLV